MQGERGLLVMLVDDGHGLAGRLASSIREMGHQVEAADSAVALRLARAMFPDVVVVEFGRNKARDAEFTRGLSAQPGLRKPFVVALLSCSEPDSDDWAREAGIDLVLVKPINIAVLSGVLRRFRNLLVGVEACRVLSEAETQRLLRSTPAEKYDP